jgi:hypothetical protein
MEPTKRPRGGQPKAPDELLLQKSIRMRSAQWETLEAAGGVPCLRSLLDNYTPAELRRLSERADGRSK